ncbi:L-alanine-DL-glutamate epimerase-like enolase superfamily enzyme [Agromyces flavus]|uniref:L-alanine-DL-glutamate epimerase n=1 Tax=Agromyces flavus TaxID=589382 RepID=A0A1H1WCG2_9MICO|nr:mandelate racemase/muconate lactonizing enzyme family protein [Agromyces flavus]MCP2366125.1 L-alanine-DL-glutamate epimerase-like enolase superfamily enzyme [Agromyces flavus]GGI44050.1 racemase [Agromyces flavus]SDS94086.1 L-alanine-DL-glutamate epimerase [Agromyces flavus]
MKITGYRTLTAQHHWRRAIGDVNGHIVEAVTEVPIVIVETDSGIEGVGIGSHADLDRLFPAIEGEDPRGVSALFDRMLAQVFKSGHAGATYGGVASLDAALWDLKAKAADEPLWRLLGGRDRFVPAYASGLDIALDDEELATLYAEFAERGFVAGKLKGGLDFDADVRRLGILADALAANTARPGLMLDANESWQVKQAVRYVSALEEHVDLIWVEEPLRRWDAVGHARLSTAIRAAVATGENLTGVDQFRSLFEAGAPDVVQAGAVWGVSHMQRLALASAARDLPISPVGYNANPAVAHVMTAVPNHLTTELQAFDFADGVLVDHEFVDGGIVLGDEPGSGISIDEVVIEGARRGDGWANPAGPHMRPVRAGLRVVLDGVER